MRVSTQWHGKKQREVSCCLRGRFEPFLKEVETGGASSTPSLFGQADLNQRENCIGKQIPRRTHDTSIRVDSGLDTRLYHQLELHSIVKPAIAHAWQSLRTKLCRKNSSFAPLSSSELKLSTRTRSERALAASSHHRPNKQACRSEETLVGSTTASPLSLHNPNCHEAVKPESIANGDGKSVCYPRLMYTVTLMCWLDLESGAILGLRHGWDQREKSRRLRRSVRLTPNQIMGEFP
ncbi:uncharacterized protein [Oscarella lobularis]|uniref:uncharacterized protein n=1 Tax=Oscarella lobularis TaxID=121494 RepID=UPI0033132A35